MTEEQSISTELERFADAEEVFDLVKYGQPFLKTAAAARAAKSDLFAQGLERLVDMVFRADGEKQLLAIAFAWRLTSVTAMREHRRYLVERLDGPSPRPSVLPTVLSDPMDRKNLAEALRWKSDEWVTVYLIQSIANVKDGKLARIAACESLLTKGWTLSQILEGLAFELRNLELDQIDSDLGRARQLTSILEALGDAIWIASIEIALGDDFGSTYRMLLDSVVATGEISERPVRLNLATAAIEFYLKLARLKSTLAAQSESYVFIRAVKRIFAPADWPPELAQTLDVLARRAAEQLIFMMQLGTPNKDLRDLILYLKSEVGGKIYLEKIAAETGALSEDDRFWLITGRGRKALVTEQAVGDAALSQYDYDLANLYKSIDALSELSETAISAFENEAEILPDSTTAKVRRYFQKVKEAQNAANSLFKKRGLKIKGHIGQVIEFNPSEHEPTAQAIGEKTVRVKSKLVERELGNGRQAVVSKADVDKT